MIENKYITSNIITLEGIRIFFEENPFITKIILEKTKSFRPAPNLYIVGFMGVGKSTIGRKVARELGYHFIDSDKEIEKKTGQKISEIFANEGELAFREMEREFINNGHPESRCVVSCGGGLVVSKGVVKILKKKGLVISLFASTKSIIERIGRDRTRPLLDIDYPEERVRKMMAEREPIYKCAGNCITTDDQSVTEVVRQVMLNYFYQILL